MINFCGILILGDLNMPNKSKPEGTYYKISSAIREHFKGEMTINGETKYVERPTQEQLTLALGLPKSDRPKISDYELGKQECPMNLLIKWADVLDTTVDALLGRPFRATYHSQNNRITSMLLDEVQPGVYSFNTSKKGNAFLDYKFKDGTTTIRGYVLQNYNKELDLPKGSLIIVDTNVKKYINYQTINRFLCMFLTSYVKEGTQTAKPAYFFTEVGMATDIKGNGKVRSFYFKNEKKQLVIGGCQYVQRQIAGVVIQAIKYFVK